LYILESVQEVIPWFIESSIEEMHRLKYLVNRFLPKLATS